MNGIVSFLEVTDLTGAIVIGVFVLFTIALMTGGAVLLAKAIQQQNKYNNTALPRMVRDDDVVENPEYDQEEATVFDLDSIDDEYEDEGFESDKWFAQARGIDEEELVDIRRRREQSSSRAPVVEEEEEDFLDDTEEEEIPEQKPRGLPEQPRGRSTSLPKL